MGETVVIKGVDARSYRNFRGEAVKAGLKVGEAATEAFRLWVEHRTERIMKDTDRLRRACETMDRNRARTQLDETWDSAEVIRRWRDARRPL